MGRSSGAFLGLVLLALVFLKKPSEQLEAKDFIPTFATTRNMTLITPPSITYKQYFEFATAPREEVEEDPETQLTVSAPITQTATKTGVWRTINGRIPTPQGTTIPLPTRRVRGSRIAVEKMLEPIGEEKPEEYFADVEHNGKLIKSVNLRLKPL